MAPSPGGAPSASQAAVPGRAGADRVPWVAALLAGCLAWGSVAAEAQQATVRVTNMVPDFLSFYEGALEEREPAARGLERPEPEPGPAEEEPAPAEDEAGPAEEETGPAERPSPADRRWALWQERYGFPALPEDEAGREAVRGRLEAVWPRYGQALQRIRASAGAFEPAPAPFLRNAARVLRLDRPLEVHLVVYVGMFERGPSFEIDSGEYRLLFPVERAPADRRAALHHAFSEPVQARLSGRPEDRPPTLAERLLARGIGLRVHETLVPGLPAERYLLRSLDWLLEAESRDRRILEWLRPRLGDRSPETFARLAEGRGVTGLGGELDYAAWRLVGHILLHHRWTLDRLARVPAREVPGLVAEAIDEALVRSR